MREKQVSKHLSQGLETPVILCTRWHWAFEDLKT